jgi:D-alanyl-D-alanine carboxypeptidase (penicillin-binding protein 5/6)
VPIVPITATLTIDEILDSNTTYPSTSASFDNATVNESYYKYLQAQDLDGKYVMVYNKTANQIIFEKNVDTICYPASMTKLLTAVVALEYISPETIFTVGSELDLVSSGSSLAYLGRGERISLNDLLYGLMLPSGNDAGYTIAVNVARTVSGDSTLSDKEAVEYFASLMNQVAQKIGMVNSHFVVPDGFHDAQHYVTARDMIKLLLYTDNYPIIKQVTSTYKYEVTVESGQDYIWLNSNKLIDSTSEFYYEGVSTGKTGFHDDAGHCIAFTCEKNGIELYIVIMDSQTAIYRNRDALNLLNMVYNPLDIKLGDAWDIDPNETTIETSETIEEVSGNLDIPENVEVTSEDVTEINTEIEISDVDDE